MCRFVLLFVQSIFFLEVCVKPPLFKIAIIRSPKLHYYDFENWKKVYYFAFLL